MNRSVAPAKMLRGDDPRDLAHAILRDGNRGAVARLAQMALAGDEAATEALFARVVEPLCDGFTAQGALACDRVMAQVIDASRSVPACAPLTRAMAAEGIDGEGGLLARAGWGTHGRVGGAAAPRRIGVLSRVTLGADLAITVPLIRGLAARWPDAEIVYFGPPVGQAAAEAAGARFVSTEYGRRVGLAARLNAWADLRASLRQETAGLGPADWLLVDPDSRLTQLGLLAPGPRLAYRRLPSRTAAGGISGRHRPRLVRPHLRHGHPRHPAAPASRRCGLVRNGAARAGDRCTPACRRGLRHRRQRGQAGRPRIRGRSAARPCRGGLPHSAVARGRSG
ncbi:hypothetical protein OCGS_2176 [Oceaniovalibus guishaninsula JLT2003]|uniref:Uncharacterized protein n=1 Tax=Oceaniovalibus guishaninsula JLT2003 TaxID=1231392 RepID=K2HAZ1_9RHOB|nr:hypothetical protein [Oceaniovalibus guishaninsula]EKE43842.1 hypothetical protein OCGS_2176 [Oceaniovalibus guishaninsula JLT2003]